MSEEVKVGFVLEVRRAVGETQVVFADRLGISLRALRGYEIEGTLPKTKAVLRALDSLAKKYGVPPREQIVETNSKP